MLFLNDDITSNMVEIERKFLVSSKAFKQEAQKKTYLVQGFLNSTPERTVRVRISGDQAFLTVKGKSTEDGLSRFEWEKNIKVDEAKELLKLCEPGIIEKTRFEIPIGNHTYEVDEFYGDNKGLIIAEIELESTTESFERPDWLGKEVTGETNYYNSQLSKNPYNTWKH